MPSFTKNGKSPKLENADPRSKLMLRRYFLDRYHPHARMPAPPVRSTPPAQLGPGWQGWPEIKPEPPPRVFDACQAGGLLWTQLRKEYAVRYWGVDLKPQRKGTLKVDSVRILAQPQLPFDVIDIDTFGPPWNHWLAMLPNLRRQPVTVFLTLGQIAGIKESGSNALEWIGVAPLIAHMPSALRWKLAEHATSSLLTAPIAYGFRIVDAQESTPSRNARYLGVRLEPASL